MPFGRGGVGEWRFDGAERLTTPVLVLAGGRGREGGLAPQREIARRLPRGRLLVYDASGHFPNPHEPARSARDVGAFPSER